MHLIRSATFLFDRSLIADYLVLPLETMADYVMLDLARDINFNNIRRDAWLAPPLQDVERWAFDFITFDSDSES